MVNKRITSKHSSLKNNIGNNIKTNRSGRSLISKLFLPEIHGVSKNNFIEFIDWGKKRWMNRIHSCEMKVVQIIKLPVYSPYLFGLYRIKIYECLWS